VAHPTSAGDGASPVLPDAPVPPEPVEATARRRRRIVLGEQARQALVEAVVRRHSDPEFAALVRRIVDEDRELLDRLAR
jgi:hypothetical protein